MASNEKVLGRYRALCKMNDSDPFLVLGCDKYPFLLCFVIVNLLSVAILVLLNRSYKETQLFFTVHLVIIIYLDLMWLGAALVNPGIQSPINYQVYGCMNCKDFKQDDSHQVPIPEHCVKCGVCIDDREYHSFLIGGCVGARNKFSFYFFMLGGVIYFIDLLCTAPIIFYS